HHGKWDKSRGKQGKLREEVLSAKEEVRPEYEEYLLLLQQRNRILKKLKEKNEQEIELEKKEQGFSIYVNGANVELGQAYSRAKSRSSSRHAKTAGDAHRERKKILQHELETLEREAEARDVRVKTAPDPTPSSRKGWKYDSIQIKTVGGKSVRLRAPGRITGKYSEDFESVAVESSDSASDQDVADNDLSDQDELEFNSDDDEDELTLSFNDVETLRKSLEADESIKESIEAAKKRIEEETKEKNANNNNIIDDDNEDEIEEELEGANSSLNLHDAAVLERLPQLTSTPDKRQHEVESSINTSNSISEGVGFGKTSSVDTDHEKTKSVKSKDLSVTSDGNEKKTHQRSKKHKHESVNPVEDLVVLSFSSSTVISIFLLPYERRKKNADPYDSTEHFSSRDDRSYTKQQKRSEKHESGNQEVTLTSASEKKSRPLSATRRMEPKDKLDDNAEEIFKAMAEENQTVESKASGSQTAPVRSKNVSSSPLHEVKRPSSLASFPLKTDDTIALVTEKVRKMDARQQQSLIELLSKLECKAPFKVSSPSPSPRLSPMKATVPFTPVTKSSSIESQSKDFSVMDSLDDAENDKAESEEGTDVYFEIISNWGNSSYVGLTEIQFFDLKGNTIPYDEHNVSLSGHVGDGGVLGNLANGKTKTTKGRYMWSCGFQTKHPVELVFHLPSGDATSLESHGLSKISVWNYNRGIKELNVGVKDVRIFVGGDLVWEGVIDKGCGNQVFDYCKVINLIHTNEKSEGSKEQAQDPEPIIRSETVVLRRSVDGQKEENEEMSAAVECDKSSEQDVSRCKTVLLKSSAEEDPQRKQRDIKDNSVEQYKNERHAKDGKQSKEHEMIPKPPESPRMHPKSPRPHRQEKSAEESKAGQQQQGQDRTKEKALRSLLAADLTSSDKKLEEQSLVTRSSSTPNLSSSEALGSSDVNSDSLRGNSVAGSVLPNKPPWLESSKKKDKSGSSSRSSSRSKSRPIWLENEPGVDPARSNSLTDVRLASDDLFKSEKPHSRPSSGRRSSTPGASDKSESWPSEFLGKDESLPTCLDGKAGQLEGKGRTGSGRRKDEDKGCSEVGTEETGAQHDAKQARATWRREQNLSLEESWSLLSLFEKSHRGRITKDLDLENHGDALDEMLSKREEHIQPITEQSKEIDESDHNYSDGYFLSGLTDLEIPTLPRGKQLVIYIKNTWGDRNYVGLNGIEVFTDCGKPAEIIEISADPPDINILPEYGNDPRIVTNLIDGVFRTRDDMHLWLAPFTPGGKHSISITFAESTRIAMIRIWNYNKSRIHSFRGVRCIDLTLDGSLIFQGEIARASGVLGTNYAFGDTIMFTMDEDILEAMAQYDQTYEGDEEDEDELLRSCYFERPSTADQAEEESDVLSSPRLSADKRNSLQKEALYLKAGVNVLPGVVDDIRTPDKLIDGVNDTYDGRH
ncbi:hypothetical protein pdam_00023677, partial [Pocillopora damicornis]